MTHDMTKGPLLPQLIGFTIPLILGNFLQLTYNAVDSIILGRFVSAGALAAAGTCNPLMTMVCPLSMWTFPSIREAKRNLSP